MEDIYWGVISLVISWVFRDEAYVPVNCFAGEDDEDVEDVEDFEDVDDFSLALEVVRDEGLSVSILGTLTRFESIEFDEEDETVDWEDPDPVDSLELLNVDSELTPDDPVPAVLVDWT